MSDFPQFRLNCITFFINNFYNKILFLIIIYKLFICYQQEL